MEISLAVLTSLLQDAAELGATAALSKYGLIKPYMTKTNARDSYGRGIVDRWIKEGLVTPRKDGNHSASWRIERAEIEAVAKANNRSSYLTVAERE
jgi:hypothetical protein